MGVRVRDPQPDPPPPAEHLPLVSAGGPFTSGPPDCDPGGGDAIRVSGRAA